MTGGFSTDDGGLEVIAARDRLVAWSRLRPLVDPRIFSGELIVRSHQLIGCRIVRLVERRSERREAIPADQRLPELPRYTPPLNDVAVNPPADFRPRTWQLIKNGSKALEPCPAGCNGGRQHCRHCQGGRVTCPSCGGSGRRWVSDIVDDRHVQREERCPYCELGRTRCHACGGKGWQRCRTCHGAGALTAFTRGQVEHTPTETRYAEPLPEPIKAGKLKDDDWQTLETRTGRPTAALVPSELTRLFGDELGRPAPGEILRRVQVLALADTVVTLPDHPRAVLHIVGRSQRIFATGVRLPHRTIVFGAAMCVIVVVVVVILFSQVH